MTHFADTEAQAAYSKPTAGQLSYTSRLAVYIALKYTEQQTKVHKVTLEKSASLVGAHSRIMAELQARADGQTGASSATAATGTAPSGSIMGLRDYIQVYGNPLAARGRLQLGMVNDQAQILVLRQTPSSMPPGMHSLKDVVAGAAQGVTSPGLNDLMSMAVDSMEQVSLVKSLVAEYASRASWMQHVNRLRADASDDKRSEASSREPGKARLTCTSTGSGGDFADAMSDSGSVAAPPPPSTPVKQEIQHSPAPKAGALDFHSARSVGSPPPQTERAPTGASPAASKVGQAPAATPPPTPAPSLAAASPAPSLATSPGAHPGSDRAVEKIAKRIFDYTKLFTASTWRGSIRGKEGAIQKMLDERVMEDMKKAKAARREDKLPRLEYLARVTQAILRLLSERKSKTIPESQKYDKMKFWADIETIAEYLENEANHQRFGETGPKLLIDPRLRKIQVVAVALGVWFLPAEEAPQEDSLDAHTLDSDGPRIVPHMFRRRGCEFHAIACFLGGGTTILSTNGP